MSSNSAGDPRREAVRRSALWAAYGDALGFITELTDATGVKRRAGTREVTRTVPWSRRVGGQYGAMAELPAGCISDDTQLRLATSRAMRADGSFDIEAFSKVELTVWPAYALGAGRGSKAAAAALARRDTTWASNFFDARGNVYVQGGGNGAAMRIQPHVWAHRDGGPLAPMLRDVLINAICTHGHPRGFLGAVLHARCLELTLRERRPAETDDLHRFADELIAAAELLVEVDTVRDLWLGPWEERSHRSLEAAVSEVSRECHVDIKALERAQGRTPHARFHAALDALDARAPEQRGSGTKTALLAATAASLFAGQVEDGVVACANALGTDTDTIATMAGALLGALADVPPAGPLQDHDYIVREADRMWGISVRAPVPNFPTVDLLVWTPPRSQSDVVRADREQLAMAGLGPARSLGDVRTGRGRDQAAYEWVTLWFGQSVLVKRRPKPHRLAAEETVRPDPRYLSMPVELTERSSMRAAQPVARAAQHAVGDQTVLLDMGAEPVAVRRASDEASRHDVTPSADRHARERDAVPLGDEERRRFLEEVSRARTLHQVTGVVIRSGFDKEVIGAGLLKTILGSEEGIERAMAYAAIVGKARVSRRDLLESPRGGPMR